PPRAERARSSRSQLARRRILFGGRLGGGAKPPPSFARCVSEKPGMTFLTNCRPSGIPLRARAWPAQSILGGRLRKGGGAPLRVMLQRSERGCLSGRQRVAIDVQHHRHDRIVAGGRDQVDDALLVEAIDGGLERAIGDRLV